MSQPSKFSVLSVGIDKKSVLPMGPSKKKYLTQIWEKSGETHWSR